MRSTITRNQLVYKSGVGQNQQNTKKGGWVLGDSPFLLEIDVRSDGGRLVAELFLNDALAFGALKLPVQQELFGHFF